MRAIAWRTPRAAATGIEWADPDGAVRSGGPEARALTVKEVVRLDARALADLAGTPTDAASAAECWLRTVLVPNGAKATRHCHAIRLEKYEGATSRDQRYVELLPAERDALSDVNAWLSDVILHSLAPPTRRRPMGKRIVVEVGFNASHQMSKVGVVVPMGTVLECHARARGTGPPSAPWGAGASTRSLFLCLGMDRGLKTFYITPRYKQRRAYKCHEGCTYMGAHAFSLWMGARPDTA